eukprot:TRINITY_DN27625_c0_g1_i2.p1 TRINITY_DN27625_c0_g1~~TRINITY_DN27625_c0_g1_i2.p1  ORF type:complete len:456 (-),score=51.25 TRINITY_DN27625_c0_g1_i2:699-2066(-)
MSFPRFLGAAVANVSFWWEGTEAERRQGIEQLSCMNAPHSETWWELRNYLTRWVRGNSPRGWESMVDGWGGHPMSSWTHLPEYDECPLGALALRLWHLMQLSDQDASPFILTLGLTGSFLEEIRLLFRTAPWSVVLLSGWAHVIFLLLAELSNAVCRVHVLSVHLCDNDGEGPPLPIRKTDATDQIIWHSQLVGWQNVADASVRAKPTCSFFRAMLEVSGLMHHLPFRGEFFGKLRPLSRVVAKAFSTVQQALEPCGRKNRFGRVVGTRRLVFRMLGELADPGDLLPDSWRPRPERRSLNEMVWFGVVPKWLPVRLCGEPLCIRSRINLPSHGAFGAKSYLSARVLGASVMRFSNNRAKNDVRLEVSIFFEPRGPLEQFHEACDTYFGASFFRIECDFQQKGLLGVNPTIAAVVSVFAFRRIRPPNMLSCPIPPAVNTARTSVCSPTSQFLDSVV